MHEHTHSHPSPFKAVKGPHTDIGTFKLTYFSNLPKSPQAWGGGDGGSLLPHLAQEKPVLGLASSDRAWPSHLLSPGLVPGFLSFPYLASPAAGRYMSVLGKHPPSFLLLPSETTELFLLLLSTPSQLGLLWDLKPFSL